MARPLWPIEDFGYEIWGLDDTQSDMDGGLGHHREDFTSLSEAVEALPEWQTHGKAAWIVLKGDPHAAEGGSALSKMLHRDLARSRR